MDGLQLMGMGGEGHGIERRGGRRIEVSRRGREGKAAYSIQVVAQEVMEEVSSPCGEQQRSLFLSLHSARGKSGHIYNIERVHVFAIMQGHFHVLPRPTHLSPHTQLKRNTASPYWSHQHRASPRLVARIHSTSEPDYPLPQKSRWEGRYSSSLQLPAPLHSLCHVNNSTPHSCEPKMHTKQVQLTENMAYLHQPCSYIGVEVNMWNISTQCTSNQEICAPLLHVGMYYAIQTCADPSSEALVVSSVWATSCS